MFEGGHHLRGEELEIAKDQSLRDAWVTVTDEQVLEAAHLLQLLDPLDDVLR
jgi:hypothetical protein